MTSNQGFVYPANPIPDDVLEIGDMQEGNWSLD
jgi:hypothetical protein